jgi:hypothetical protein
MLHYVVLLRCLEELPGRIRETRCVFLMLVCACPKAQARTDIRKDGKYNDQICMCKRL